MSSLNVAQVCGWSNCDPKSGCDRMATLIEHDEYEKAAALYIFQMNVDRALQVLNDGLQRGIQINNNICILFNIFFSLSDGKGELVTLTLALAGFIRATSTNNDDKTLANHFSALIK
jgi:hypothetical protein